MRLEEQPSGQRARKLSEKAKALQEETKAKVRHCGQDGSRSHLVTFSHSGSSVSPPQFVLLSSSSSVCLPV